jgi:diguanylate cyclase (GGDEF)-like protein/PAS domain S-box-containing protein
MFLVLDRNGNVVLINKKGAEILGYTKEEIIDKNWFDTFIPEDERGEIERVFTEVIAGNADLLEYYENPVLTKDGKQKVIAFRNSLLTDDMGNIVGTLSSGEDITERMLYEKKLKDFASKDDLTGVLNKRAGFDVLNHVFERAKNDKIHFTICFMDFDGLKFVNDNFGHDKGDAYIISIVNALKATIRDSDYIMRFGGDEFMLILPKCTEAQALEVIKRANKKIDAINQSKLFPFKLGMSYGFAEFDLNNQLSIDELIKTADTKMYKMKEEHRSMENGSSS